MKIAIITNFKECCTMEDYILSKSFAEDGHHVDLLDFPIIEGYENNYDLLIIKNTWDLNEKTYKKYFLDEEQFFQRVQGIKTKIVNTLDGKLNFRKLGKRILADLYKKGYNVVPTIDDMSDFGILPKAEKYVKKPIIGYDGFDMQFIDCADVHKFILDNEVLQPKLEIKSEVQMYFVNDKFEYALEYTPSKWPDYPTPREIIPSHKDIEMALKFIKINNQSCGFSRIDFLKLHDDSLIMLEMADSNPNMSLPLLSHKTLEKFLTDFKHACYEYVMGAKNVNS